MLARLAAAAALAGIMGLGAFAQQPATTAAAPARAAAAPQPANPPAIVTGAYWHHVTMNVADPAASIDFYARHFKSQRATWNGQPALWTQRSWLLFNKTTPGGPKRFTTAIWHIGWGAPNPQAEYARQQSLGAKFFTPITDIAINNGGTLGRFFYMYVEDPDGGLIELNTAANDNFGHMHAFSEDPIVTGDWYMRMFGFTGRALSTPTTPSRDIRLGKNGNQIGPSSSLRLNNVNLIIYPAPYSRFAYKTEAWNGSANGQLVSTRGGLYDHMGIGVPNLDAALKQLAKVGIKPAERVKSEAGGRIRSTFIEGPDKIAIQLIEDHTDHPPLE